VRISSILPPKCEFQENISLPAGSPVLSAYAHYQTNSTSIISATVGVAIPKHNTDHGMIMEVSGAFSKSAGEIKIKEMLTESMELRKISIKDIKIKSVEAYVSDNSKYVSTFAAILLW